MGYVIKQTVIREGQAIDMWLEAKPGWHWTETYSDAYVYDNADEADTVCWFLKFMTGVRCCVCST